MQPTRYCLALAAFCLFLSSAALLQAQDQAEPVPAVEEPGSGELKEIDRPQWADKQPAPSSATGRSAQGGEVKNADYWFNRGVLLSVYGNEKAAIDAFQKAAALAPQWSSPLFQMGVAFGENGQFAEALDAINKAIALDPGKGAYYYGRARVHLLFGDAFNARVDFEKAAELGDRDAIRYLSKQAP